MTKQPTTTSQAPKNRAGQPQGNAGLLFRVTKMDVKSEYPLPTFSYVSGRAPYARYCPNIECIDKLIGCGHWNYTVFVTGDCTAQEVAEQLQDLAEYYATAETELETA